MIHIKWVASDLHACGHIRGELMAREVNRNIANMSIDLKNCIVMSDYPKTNLMVFQRSCMPELLVKIDLAKSLGVKLIYETDDDVFNIPEGFMDPYKHYADPKVRRCIIDSMDKCDAISVSTMELANSVAIVFPKKPIFVIDNFLSIAEWEIPYERRIEKVKNGKPITIGWMASGSHTIDIPLVAKAIEETMDKHPEVMLHLIGWVGWKNMQLEKHKNRILCEDWLPIDAIPYAMSNFDINLCPIMDNKFNRCKSNLKYLQGGVLGIPSICSKLPPYGCVQDGVDGLLADSPESWLACLDALIENSEMRRDIGEKARAKVVSEYDMSKNYMNWVKMFQKVLS